MPPLTILIKKLIQEKGSLRQLARELGLDHGNLSRSLKGDSNPRLDTIEKLLNHLGYEIHIVRSKKIDKWKGVKQKLPGSGSTQNTKEETQMKSLSIKLGVMLLVIGLTVCSAKVWGQDWQEFVEATTGIFAFDKASVRTTSEGFIRVWIHNMTKNKSNLVELNCKGNLYKVLDSVDYDEAFRLKDREPSYDNPEWLTIAPKSIPEALRSIVCP